MVSGVFCRTLGMETKKKEGEGKPHKLRKVITQVVLCVWLSPGAGDGMPRDHQGGDGDRVHLQEHMGGRGREKLKAWLGT